MHTLNITPGGVSYPVFIGQQLLGNPELLAPFIRGHQVAVVSSKKAASLYLETLRKALGHFQVTEITLEDGEPTKSLAMLEHVVDCLLRDKHERSTTLIALGGGVTGDLCGFSASCYMRGVSFIQIPTTLLAQVDSSVGGKTGINHKRGKNMIGAFYQPACVLADVDVLATLPDRELSAGLAEVIKYGLIADPLFFAWLESHMDALVAKDSEALMQAVLSSCKNKALVVAEDEKEQGRRAILNFGHTFGHALETWAGYGNWLHGEAVAVGMVMATELSVRLGWVEEPLAERVRAVVQRANLPVSPPDDMKPEDFLDLMRVDKKTVGGQLRLVLLKALGEAVVTSTVPSGLLREQLAASCQET
ncbi:MAG: 3-dehydroquinate synthase [Kistimonas sp.]|nr:3-dehydroquinate synthase [Kistimonas sp.]